MVDAASASPSVPSAPAASAAKPSPPPPPRIFGTWRRATEPYEGLVIAIREGSAVIVSRAPVTDERVSKQAGDISKGKPPRDADRRLARSQLECQQSLWKADERYLDELHGDGDDYTGKIVVRDWGLTQGVCRHASSSWPAHLHLVDADTLTMDVKRGQVTSTQEWKRVR